MKSSAIYGDSRSEIQRAKKCFHASLALFCGVVLFWIFAGLTNSDTQVSEETVAANRKAQILKEFAQLLGEACGLSEHPKTLPPLERKWIVRYGQQVIRKMPEFKGLSESEQEPLAEAFFEGYAQRYDDYYDPSIAQAAGFKYAKQVFLQLSRIKKNSLDNFLELQRPDLTQRYGLEDEARWILFCRTYKRGFRAGLKVAYYEENERTYEQKTNHE